MAAPKGGRTQITLPKSPYFGWWTTRTANSGYVTH